MNGRFGPRSRRRRTVRFLLLAALLALAPGALYAQARPTRRITGTVKEPNGRPVPYATVGAAGAAPVKVDEEGRFAAEVPAGAVALVARAIGHTPQTVRIAADVETVAFVLDILPFSLGEIVISGAAPAATQHATTATAAVTSTQLTQAPAQSIEQALQGKILGASINMNSGAPGGGGQIQIRGMSSVLGNGEPLVVIDGIISSNDAFSAGASTVTRGSAAQDQNVNRLADINPQEIESIEIVKDASATAVYGSRASNGVIVIRTKRGASGSSRYSLHQSIGEATPLRYLGTRQFSTVAEVLALRFGATANSAAQSYLQQHYPDGTIPAAANVDLERDFFDNRKPSYESAFTASGGNSATRYYASITQKHDEGIARNNGATLQSARLNLDQTITPALSISANLNVIHNALQRGLANNDNSFTSPVYAFAYTPDVFDLRVRDAAGNYVRNPIFGGGTSASNPFETYDYLKYTQDVWRTLGSFTATYVAVDRARNRLVFNLLGGLDRYEQAGSLYSPGFLQYEGRNGLFGTSEQATVDGLNYNLQPTATWTLATSRATFTSALGASAERQDVDNYSLVGRGLVAGNELASQGTITTTEAVTAFSDQAVFVNEQINAFDDRLVVNGGVRADRSSGNGDQTKFYFFPRLSTAYRFGNPVRGIDELKLRVGVGQTGNRPRYGDRWVALSSGAIVQGQGSAQISATVGNPNIRPETLTEESGGFDVEALGERITGELTLYRRTITDLLLQPPGTPSTGYGTLIINGGELRNQGVEAGVSFIPIQTNTASWTSRVTFQHKSEVVTSLPASVPPFFPGSSFGASFGRNRIAAGQSSTTIWGNAPVDAAGKVLPVGAYVTSPSLIAGVRDTIIGDANPTFQMFFENTLQWKAFTFAVTTDWRKGGDVANTTTKLYDEGGTSRDFTSAVTAENAPRGTPANSIGTIPNTILGVGDFRFQAWRGGSDARVYLQDGSYVRVREIALTAVAPRRFAETVGASSLTVGLRARNVFMFTNYWGYDPEFNNYGNQNVNRFIDTAPYPGARSFNLSFDLAF
jgi:TonB-linked SusC/RagA family outer membrane protein